VIGSRRTFLGGIQRGPWFWAVAGIVVTVLVTLRYFTGIDEAAARWMAAVRTPTLDAIARLITFFGSAPWCMSVMGAVSVWWWRKRRYRGVEMFWCVWLVGIVIEIVLRFIVPHWRPDAGVLPVTMDPITRFQLSGFTSGHAFRSAFLYGWGTEVLFRRGTRAAQLCALGLGGMVLLVGVTRIYLHRHWFSDVLGAWIVAAFVLAIARAWHQRTPESSTVNGGTSSHP